MLMMKGRLLKSYGGAAASANGYKLQLGPVLRKGVIDVYSTNG